MILPQIVADENIPGEVVTKLRGARPQSVLDRR